MTEQLVRALIAARKSNKVSGAKDGHGISLDAQDEDAREFCERHGWEVAGAAQDIISGTVAPMKRKDLGRWLTDPARLHSFDVIVFAHIDRISRGTDGDFSDIESWAHTNGKKLVMADSNGGIMFPSRNGQDFWMWTATKRQAGQEWQRIRARIWSARKNITSQGGIMGRAGWGYQIAGDRYAKSLVPTDTCVRYAPEIYQRIADGDSLRAVAQWLDSEGVPTDAGKRWNEGVLSALIKSRTYMGEREQSYPEFTCTEDHQHSHRCPTRQVKHVIPVPAVVSRDLWYEANQALRHRKTRKDTGGRPSAAPALLRAMKCGSPDCHHEGTSPMCRIKAGKGEAALYFYRCTGVGAQRKGCGNMLPLDIVDRAVLNRIAYLSNEPEMTTVVERGRNVEAEIDGLKGDLAALDVMADDFLEKAAALKSEIVRLSHLPAEADIVREVPTGRTIGKAFSELDLSSKRTWLADHDIRAWSDQVGIWVSIDGVTISPDQTSLGVDHWHEIDAELGDEVA